MIKSKERSSELNDLFSYVASAFDRKITRIMDENPDSYNTIERMSIFTDKLENKRIIKDEYMPSILNDKVKEYIVKNVSKDEMLYHYNDLSYSFKRFLRKYKDEFFNFVYDDPYIPAFDIIQMGSCHWFNHERFDHETTKKLYSKLTSNIGTPFNDDRFTTKFVCTKGKFGKSIPLDNINHDEFLIQEYDLNSSKYEMERSGSIWLDARLGLVFYFKNKPSFFISFYLDDECNVYIRQIQGFKKSRGHYVLGNDWQSKVIDFVKKDFTFAKKVHIIDSKSALKSLKLNYITSSENKDVNKTLKKASLVYDKFKTDIKVKTEKINISVFGDSPFSIKDEFYLL